MKNKRIIITGGAGFIGSHLAHLLCDDNEVIVIDNLITGRYENLSDIIGRIEFIEADLSNIGVLKRLFESGDYVLHQAALPSVQRSVDDPLASNAANVVGTLNVLVAARNSDIEKVVYASSSSVYGDTPTLPKKEDMKPNPQSPYAVTKLAGEYYCRVFSEIYGLKTACLRYFNVYGPRQNPNSQYAAVIPIFISRILENKPPIIFGDGNQTRDFTFVRDVAKANILAMETEAEGVFNIACERRTSLNTLADHIMDIAGFKIKPLYSKPRKGDVRDSLADISAARRELYYEPDFDIISGLTETVKWFQRT